MSGKRAVIFGASGGIGAAITTQLRRSGDFATVLTGMRSEGGDFRFDLTDEPSIAVAASTIAAQGSVDLVIVATGVLHTDDGHGPEKSWRVIDPARMAHVFAL
ncbi:MAG: C-factor, partial [Sphingomonadales bacterium]|nr:C-factor [Sphingomonadales bacterium]